MMSITLPVAKLSLNETTTSPITDEIVDVQESITRLLYTKTTVQPTYTQPCSQTRGKAIIVSIMYDSFLLQLNSISGIAEKDLRLTSFMLIDTWDGVRDINHSRGP